MKKSAGYDVECVIKGLAQLHGVRQMFVDHAAAAMGLTPAAAGTTLLRAMRRIAMGQGAERMFLEVRPSNPRAIALYHEEGFNEIGRRPRYYPDHDGRREDAIVMAMELLPD